MKKITIILLFFTQFICSQTSLQEKYSAIPTAPPMEREITDTHRSNSLSRFMHYDRKNVPQAHAVIAIESEVVNQTEVDQQIHLAQLQLQIAQTQAQTAYAKSLSDDRKARIAEALTQKARIKAAEQENIRNHQIRCCTSCCLNTIIACGCCCIQTKICCDSFCNNIAKCCDSSRSNIAQCCNHWSNCCENSVNTCGNCILACINCPTQTCTRSLEASTESLRICSDTAIACAVITSSACIICYVCNNIEEE